MFEIPHILGTHFSAAEDSSESSPAEHRAPENQPISGLNHIPPQNFGPPFDLNQVLPDLFGHGNAPDSLRRPDPNNENLNEPINTTEDPQITTSKTSFLKKLFTSKNGGPAPALPGAVTGAQIGTDVGGALGHVASLSNVVGPTTGIVGDALGLGAALSRTPETSLQKTNLNQVLKNIPNGYLRPITTGYAHALETTPDMPKKTDPYKDVTNEAQYALSQTVKRSKRLPRQVAGNALSFTSHAVTIGSGGASAPVTLPTGILGTALSGTPEKVINYFKKGRSVERNEHATNLLTMLGNAPAGENTPVSQYHAEQVVKALGLDPNDLRSNPNAQKLIFEKLSSW